MANFFVPGGVDKSRYSMTSEGGFEHPWKLTVNVNETLRVGLWGGYDNDQTPLKLSSNNPGIVTVSQTTPSFPDDRILSVRGKKPGFTILDASGAHGPWCSMQIEVRQGKAAAPGRSQGAADEIDFEVDPATGDLVHVNDPKAHKLYVDRVFTAVAYGILPDGYYVYCQGMELPIHVPESMVDLGLATAEGEMGQIYDSFSEAKSAANDNPATRRVAYFWGAGGAVVSPTIIGPASTPELYSTIVSVRALRDQFVSVMLPWITMAIGMIGGPKPMTVKGNQATGRIAARRGGSVPAQPPGSKAPKQLPSGPEPPKQLPQKGFRQKPTFDYRLTPHDDAGMGHLDYRHAPWSKAQKTSKFNQQTWNNLKSVVNETVEKGTVGTLKPDPAGNPQAGVVYEHRFGNPTGINDKGKPIHRVRVVVDANNHVTTAFPF